MGLIIIIAIVAALYFLFKKQKQQDGSFSQAESSPLTSTQAANQHSTVNHPTIGVNLVPADALINSPYYEKYKTVFGLVWYDGKQPQYKIDWLLESLNMGRELEVSGTYILDSIKADLPYFCETEREYDYFFEKTEPILRGSIQGMLSLMFNYASNNEMKHPSKLAYWQQRIKKLAENGNLEAQAALCAAKNLPLYKCLLAEGEPRNTYYNRYYDSLVQAANSGNPYAQLAVGEFLTPYPSVARREVLEKAANSGLSDAWYQLGRMFQALRYFDENGDNRSNALPPDEEHALWEKSWDCWFRGAKANNGIMAGWCQEFLASCYEGGDCGLPLDLTKAKYWYEKAAENGVDVNYSLEFLNKKINGVG